MPTPSLVNIPFITAPNVLFSQIPESGAGDFTVTRTTSPVVGQSTRVNAAGLIELVADNVARLDYPLGGAVNGCPALLVEPSAQNLALQSANFNTTWLAQNSATVNTNTAISPDGTQNADTINLAAVSDSRVRQAITVANSTTYTVSCFYKNIALTTGQTFRMRFNNALPPPNEFIATATIDLAAGTAIFAIGGTAGTGFSGTTTGRIENYGNGWYRVSMTFTVGTAGGNAGLFEAGNVDPGAVRSFYAWGAQLETGSVPTSYIPTTTAAVTRSADVISRTSASALIGQSEGTLYCEFEFPNADKGDVIRIDSGNDANIVEFISQTTTAQRARIRASSGIYFNYNAVPANMAINTRFKLAIAYKSGDIALYINGVSQATDTTAFTFNSALTRITLGQDIAVGRRAIRIFAVELYPTRISNLRLEFLTAPVTYTTYAQMANALSYILP